MVEKEPCVFVAGTYERTLCGCVLRQQKLQASISRPATLCVPEVSSHQRNLREAGSNWTTQRASRLFSTRQHT
jgi:hypothetical protein